MGVTNIQILPSAYIVSYRFYEYTYWTGCDCVCSDCCGVSSKKIKCEKSLLSRLPLCGRIPCVENSFFYKILSLPSFMWKNPLCGKILFMKSNLPSFVWKKSPLWKNPFYKVQFTFLCVEKSLVWKSPFYKVQFSFLGKIPCAEKSFFYKIQFTFPCFNGRQESGDSGESFSFGAEISFFSVLEQISFFLQFF